ncbi:MAG: 50S ribosomal protein L23 [Pseudomonadota bacterium]|uniref:Large ribosomal subunit protein uL23 n=1 Tax=Banduia mediterranea TaxID=3075609 RepID=A0ABU2WJD1_9GAMM|nr:50S ribosomal protein L23 [Algiphilus sp. W345]MCH9826534.1 50S ribosomal protein L23 [Gammaproteobacteria bacterium]MDT0497975.1 50S ribosomal protein L23 [Algiphilus sp. W345]MEC9358824.1 50S ribosomal protein L23 [Pseudomonadota bacterium]
MNVDRLHSIILAPVISEKANRVAEKQNQAVFKVLPNAEKAEIREAVEKLFNVKVTSVQTLNVKGKTKRFGQMMGRRSDWKKAYVTLAEGEQIDFLGQS